MDSQVISRGGDQIPRPAEGFGPLLQETGAGAKPLRQQVFEHVRGQRTATRAEITRALDISAGSVTQLTADLIARSFLEEVDDTQRETGRGRPPTALRVVPDTRLVLGIKISDETHTAVITDLAGNERGSATKSTRPHKRSINALTAEIEELLQRAVADAGCDRSELAAIGMGLAGLVDHPTGMVAWSPFLSGRDLRLKDELQDHLGLPVYVDNDVNLLTLAELWFGAGRSMSNFVVVTIEQGVGMGLVINNQVYRGARGMGLELGHTKVQLEGALCRCGKRGCLEAYVADYALVREASTALDRPLRNLQSPQTTLDALFREAKAGNATALSIFQRAGRYLSLGLSNVVQVFDPELIILSGARMQYDFLYADEVLAEMQSHALDDHRPQSQVQIHTWGDLVWARGATALALSAETDRAMGEAWGA